LRTQLGLKLEGRVAAIIATVTIASIVTVASVFSYWFPTHTQVRLGGGVGFVGKTVFTILEGNNYTISTASTKTGNIILNQLTLNAPNSTFIRIDLFDHYDGTLTLPLGTAINITIDSRTYRINDPDFPPNQSNPLITISPGNTPIRYAITIPHDTQPGTYRFYFEFYSFRDSSATFMTWGNYFQVNLVVI
jgi:hypothetical protein